MSNINVLRIIKEFPSKLKKMFLEFPRKFWIVVAVTFIDSIGGTMLYPFFSLYITKKFEVGMTEAGLVLGIFSLAGLFGQMIGGALTDKFGRRKLIIFGLVFSALSTLTLGLVKNFAVLIPLAIVIGLLSDLAGPARNAMVADLLPEHQRHEGFGIMRVVGNLAWIIGPTIGGFVAARSFLALFITDAIISCVVAFLFYLFVAESKPKGKTNEPQESFVQTFIGYRKVLTDWAYMAFLFACMMMGLVYQQLYNSLSVYLRDNHGTTEGQYGFLLTASAIVVILFQFSIMRAIKNKPPFSMMAFGTIFYMIGFSMFGYVNAYWLFVTAVVIITIGEMLVVPTSQSIATNFAPEAMRGRYMGMFGMTWTIPGVIGPVLAGIMIDGNNPDKLWIIGGMLCGISVLAFFGLQLALGKQKRFKPLTEEKVEPAIA
jgi:MFS family permease